MIPRRPTEGDYTRHLERHAQPARLSFTISPRIDPDSPDRRSSILEHPGTSERVDCGGVGLPHVRNRDTHGAGQQEQGGIPGSAGAPVPEVVEGADRHLGLPGKVVEGASSGRADGINEGSEVLGHGGTVARGGRVGKTAGKNLDLGLDSAGSSADTPIAKQEPRPARTTTKKHAPTGGTNP